MSPQPDVVLDVQKYIGPCLISQKPRGRKAGRSKEKLGVHSSVHQVHHFRKNSGVGPPPPTSLPHSSVNSSYTICECCGNFKYMFNGTGPPPPPTSGNLPWAGYPLISLAGFKKNTNKPIAHHNGGLPIQGINNRNRLISQSETENVLDSGGVCSLSPPLWDDPDCLPLSKLAIHTQGVPLILANHVNYKKYKHLPSYGGKIQHSSRNNIRHFKERFELSSNNDSQSEVICHQIESDTGDKLLESSSVAEPSFSQAKELDTLNQRNISEVDVSRSSPSASDSMSITSDESSGLSECSLPRILKPRKRRKRDRWLHNGDSNVNIASNSNGLKTLLTLEPYRPLCYRFNQPDLKDDGTDECEKTFNCPDNSWSKFQETLPNESEDEDSCVTNGAAVVEEDLQRYPYPPSPFCTCSICSPRSLPTPPTSPSSGHSSSISSLPSSPSSESFLSLPLNSSSPFPTPPPSPSSLSVVDSDPLSWTYSTYQVDTKIVTTEDGSKDLEIKFISSINNSSNEKLSSVDNSSNVIIKHVQSCTSDQKPAFKTPSLIPPTQPPTRPWVTLAPPTRSSRSRRPVCVFTVMCYNILCDKYATRQMYGYCPNWALNWEYRRKGIMDEMRHYRADIISLQEVETEQFYNMFLPELKKDGYDGIFSPKSRAKTMGESERKYVDGCAIFFRTSKFRLIKERLVEFTQLAMANAEGSDDMLNRVMTKDNIGLAALLETREGAWDTRGTPMDPSQIHQPLLVCTAHIHWDPEFCDVKLIQTMMLMHELKNIVEESAQNFRPGSQKPDCNAIPLILCGDFNSLPESGVCEFLTSGRIASNHPDLKEFGYRSCLQKLSTSENPNEYTHSFKIASAYSGENMPFTNYTFDFKGIIDYTLYSETCMSPLGLLGPVDPEWLRVNKVVGCPHPHVPSDHFPLLVEYEMVPHQLPVTNGLVTRR